MKKIASNINYKKASRLGGIVQGIKGFKEKEWESYANGIIAIAEVCLKENEEPLPCIYAKIDKADPRKTPGNPPVLKISGTKKILLQQRLAGVFSGVFPDEPNLAQRFAAKIISYLFEAHNIEET